MTTEEIVEHLPPEGKGTRGARLRYRVEDRGYETPCWVWAGNLISHGYGAFGRNRTKAYAHRFFYERTKGTIPPGLQIDHLCLVKACVNPEHLEAVTPSENTRRGWATGSRPRKPCGVSARRAARAALLRANILEELAEQRFERGIPDEFCWCGCGAKTKVAPRTHFKDFAIAGRPQRFLLGHAGKGRNDA